MEPVFARTDPDDELYPCPEDDCESLVPLAGPDGFVRHMIGRHPESFVARSIFIRLVEVQLLRVEDAAEVAR